MTFYRIGSMNLLWGDTVYFRDTIQNLPDRATIKKLLDLGRISVINGPPLAILEEFETIHERLSELGIVKAEHFLEAKLDDVTPIFRKQETLDAKKQELIQKHLIIEINNRECDDC